MGKITIIAHTIRKKYETTFPPNEASPIFLGSNNFDTHFTKIMSGDVLTKIGGESVRGILIKTKDKGYLVVTHYQRLLQYIKPDVVHVFVDGTIVESGGLELSNKLEEQGYESYV